MQVGYEDGRVHRLLPPEALEERLIYLRWKFGVLVAKF